MRPATKSAIRAIAKQVVSRESEDKFSGGIVENSVNHNAAITNSDAFPVLPPVFNGTGYNQRIGNTIRPKYLNYRVSVSLNEQADLTAPYIVDVWVLTAKRVKTYNGSSLALLDFGKFLDGGDGGNYPYDGTTMKGLMPVNKEFFTVMKHKRFRLTTSTQENHLGTAHREFTMRIKCPKTLKYDEAITTGYPENFAPFTVVGWHRADGITPSADSNHVVCTSWATLHYEDA